MAKILLVDDEPDITFTIKSILNDNGFEVDVFNDPITTLKSYRSKFLWFSNSWYKDAKNDGFELYIKIREKDPKVKICFLTAIAMINEELRKTRSEIAKIIDQECVIQKPIKTEDLIRKLTSIMNINMITIQIL